MAAHSKSSFGKLLWRIMERRVPVGMYFFSGDGEFSDGHFADLRHGSVIRAVFELKFHGFPEMVQGFLFCRSEA